MANRLQHYIKYTVKELETYVATEHSCVHMVNTNMHLALKPFDMADIKQSLQTHFVQRKLGTYDAKLNGIILDVKYIKLLGTTAAIRTDDARIHLDINANCYIFRPLVGAVLSGVVKHIGKHYVGAIIYRVFNANIRFEHEVNTAELQLDQEIKFRIKNFNLSNVFPYIEGEMLTQADTAQLRTTGQPNKKMRFSSDSGIEERDATELDEMLLKNEVKPEVARTVFSNDSSTSTSDEESDAAVSKISNKRNTIKLTAKNNARSSTSSSDSDSSAENDTTISLATRQNHAIEIKRELETDAETNYANSSSSENRKRNISRCSNETNDNIPRKKSRNESTPSIVTTPIKVKTEQTEVTNKATKKTKTRNKKNETF